MPRPREELPEDFQERRMLAIAREAVARVSNEPSPFAEEWLIDLVFECRHYSRSSHPNLSGSAFARCAAVNFSFTVRFTAAVLDRFEGRERISRINKIADTFLDTRIFAQVCAFEHWAWLGSRGEQRAEEAAAYERLARKRTPGYVDARLPRREDRAAKEHKQIAELLGKVLGFEPTAEEVGDAFAQLRK